ncbi:MAG: hypothetical protein ACPIOQ_38565 [Promethearchaeia archaeon]
MVLTLQNLLQTGKKLSHRALSKRASQHDVTETSSSYDDEFSLWEADSKPEESPEQQLQLIKARTMYQMIEDVPGDGASAKRRVMFLTNAQAELIAMQPEAKGIRQLLQALEIPQPKLVINVLPSWGFSGQCLCNARCIFDSLHVSLFVSAGLNMSRCIIQSIRRPGHIGSQQPKIP